MKAGTPRSMPRVRGSRATCRISFSATARIFLMAPQPRRRVRGLDGVDEDILQRRDDSLHRRGGVAVALQELQRAAPALAGVLHHQVNPGPEDGGLQHPVLPLQEIERRQVPGAGDLQDGALREDLLELPDAPEGHQPSRVHQGDPAAVLRLVQVVRGDDDGDAPAGEPVDEAPELAPGDGVHAAGGLVQEEEAGPVEDGAGQRQPLLPAAGKGAGQEVLPARKPGRLQGPLLPLGQEGPAQAVDAAEKAQVLRDGQVLVEAEPLAHVADAALHRLGVPGHVHSEDAGAARGGPQQAAEHPDDGGLSGAVASEQAEDFPFLHRQRQIVHGPEGAEALREAVGLHGGGTGSPSDGAVEGGQGEALARQRLGPAPVRSRRSATSESRSSEEGMSPAR